MDNPFLQRPCHPAWMVAFLCLVALADLLAMPLGYAFTPADTGVAPLVMATILGVTFAQFGVLATWLVFSERALLERLALHWLLALLVFSVWAGGAIFAWEKYPHWLQDDREVLLTLGLGLPPISICLQLPLWVCRSLFGWRLLPAIAGAHRPAVKLSISDLLVATGVVAVSLACVRFGATRPNAADAQPWLMWGLSVPALFVAAAVSLLPLIAVILRPKSDTAAAVGTVLVLAGWLAVINVPLIWVAVRNGATRNPGLAQIVAVVSIFLISFLGTLAAPLWLVRRDGYRLRFPGDARRAAAQRGLAGRAAPS